MSMINIKIIICWIFGHKYERLSIKSGGQIHEVCFRCGRLFHRYN